jgi:hypothetical protein
MTIDDIAFYPITTKNELTSKLFEKIANDYRNDYNDTPVTFIKKCYKLKNYDFKLTARQSIFLVLISCKI